MKNFKNGLSALSILSILAMMSNYTMKFGIATAAIVNGGNFNGNAQDTMITGTSSLIYGIVGEAGAAAALGAAAGPVGLLVGGVLGLA
jgi:hypothetical protein